MLLPINENKNVKYYLETTSHCPITVKMLIIITTKAMIIHWAGESGPRSIIREEEDLTCGQSQGVIRVMGVIANTHSPSSSSLVPSRPGITSITTSTIIETLIIPLIISAVRQSVIVSSVEGTGSILKCNMISSQHNNVAGCYLGIINNYPELTIFASIVTCVKCNLLYTTICK